RVRRRVARLRVRPGGHPPATGPNAGLRRKWPNPMAQYWTLIQVRSLTTVSVMSTATGTVRVAVDTLAPHINKAMNALDAAARKTSLEAPLLELVRTRA